MVPIESVIGSFPSLRILVVGDVMLDRFVYGSVSRISPEAPAPIIRTSRVEEALGGAGNVACNIVSLGARCDLVGVVGTDEGGAAIRRKLADAGSIGSHLAEAPERITTVKVRFVADMRNSHLLRADWEETSAIGPALEDELIRTAAERIASADAVILSDYGKGVLTPRVIAEIIAAARSAGKPVVVDPKGHGYARYANATAITPNVAELAQAVEGPVENSEVPLADAARRLMAAVGCQTILVTRSERGVVAVDRDGTAAAFPASAQRVVDVSGAGDTLVAGFCLALAGGASVANAAHLANSAAGIVVGKEGTAHVSADELRQVMLSRPRFRIHSKVLEKGASLQETLSEWRESGFVVGFTNGCFDILHQGHVELLRQARAHCDRLIVGLNSDASVRRLKGAARPIQNEEARSTIIAALAFVDGVVVFDDDTPVDLISAILPDVLVKGADYRVDQVVGREIVEAHGGRVVLVDLFPDSSTTRIVEKMRAGQPSEGGGKSHLEPAA